MTRKYFKPEQIITKLREIEVVLSQGKSAGEACRKPISYSLIINPLSPEYY